MSVAGAWPGLALILSSTIATAGELCNYNTHINKQFAAGQQVSETAAVSTDGGVEVATDALDGGELRRRVSKLGSD